MKIKYTPFVVLTGCLLPFILGIASCDRTFSCDVAKVAKKRAQKLKQSADSSSAFEITFNANHEPISLEETEFDPIENENLSSGAIIQLLDKQGAVLFEDNIVNIESARQQIGGQVYRNADPAVIAEFNQYFRNISYQSQLPKINGATKVRLVFEDPQAQLLSLQSSSSAKPRTFEYALDQITRLNSANQFDSTLEQAKVESLYSSGSTENRLNFVVLGDGYTESEMDLFRRDADRFKTTIVTAAPFKNYKEYFNIWRIDIPSEESGVSCDDGTSRIKKNYFGTLFPIACINAKFGTNFEDRFVMQSKISRVYKAANLINKNKSKRRLPTQIFVISNSRKQGGTAIFWATETRVTDDATFVHELGHSMGGLADEYVVPQDPCDIFTMFRPNVSFKKSKASKVKWKQWIEKGTPLPTPDTQDFENVVGLFKGSSDCKWLYRPQRHCKMDDSSANWCKVCHEQMILRLYDYVRPIDGALSYVQNPDGTYSFQGKTLKSSYKTAWYVDGLEVQSTSGYQPLEMKLDSGKHTVALAVKDETTNVRKNVCHLFDAMAVSFIKP